MATELLVLSCCIVAAVLLVSGLVESLGLVEPRRGYIVLGAVSHMCPERGMALHKSRIRSAVPVRRRRWPVSGLASFVAVALMLVVDLPARSQQVSSRTDAPFSRLLREAVAGDPLSFFELRRRHDSGAIQGTQAKDLADAAWRIYIRETASPIRDRWLDLLATLLDDKLIDSSRRQEYLRRVARPVFQARSRIRVGDPLPVRLCLDIDDVRPARQCWTVTGDSLTIDGEKCDAGDLTAAGDTRRSGRNEVFRTLLKPTALSPGRHAVTLQLVLRIEPNDAQDRRKQIDPELVVSQTITLQATVDVSAAAASDPLRIRREKRLGEEVRNALRIRLDWLPGSGKTKRWQVVVDFEVVRELPCDLACEVSLGVSGEGPDESLGFLEIPHGARVSSHFVLRGTRDYWASRIEKAALYIQGSESVARHSVELLDIWGGSIVVKDLYE